MRIRDHRADDEPEINLVPMIDVILCLIIFFVARPLLKSVTPGAAGAGSNLRATYAALPDRRFDVLIGSPQRVDLPASLAAAGIAARRLDVRDPAAVAAYTALLRDLCARQGCRIFDPFADLRDGPPGLTTRA